MSGGGEHGDWNVILILYKGDIERENEGRMEKRSTETDLSSPCVFHSSLEAGKRKEGG